MPKLTIKRNPAPAPAPAPAQEQAPTTADRREIVLPATTLADALRVYHCADICRTDTALACVRLWVEQGRLCSVATDGHVLLERRLPVGGLDEIEPVFIDMDDARDLCKTLDKAKSTADVALIVDRGENTVQVSIGGSTVTERLKDVRYPSYQNALPAEPAPISQPVAFNTAYYTMILAGLGCKTKNTIKYTVPGLITISMGEYDVPRNPNTPLIRVPKGHAVILEYDYTTRAQDPFSPRHDYRALIMPINLPQE